MRDGHSYIGYVNKVPATPNFLFEVKLPHPQPPALSSWTWLFFTEEWLLIGPVGGLWPEGCLSKNQPQVQEMSFVCAILCFRDMGQDARDNEAFVYGNEAERVPLHWVGP